ncbi:Transcription factor [Penicillium occitanis (nom. inval.)]|nr:Transcription factor [Penicillium occitanis (nom. inval.)]PCG92215.1 hypothetical protein PENOC_093660 [Penicillium occitanis (nom. inval.)]
MIFQSRACQSTSSEERHGVKWKWKWKTLQLSSVLQGLHETGASQQTSKNSLHTRSPNNREALATPDVSPSAIQNDQNDDGLAFSPVTPTTWTAGVPESDEPLPPPPAESVRQQVSTNSVDGVGVVDPENFLEWLMFDLQNSSAVPLPLTDVSMLSPMQMVSGQRPGQGGDQRGDNAYEASKMAVRQISTIINDLCRTLNSDAETTGVTSDFFDACMHEYFERVLPSFPVLHAPTFQAQDCISPLLLNILALGSLFVTMPGSNEKGEIIWRLAHTAVATSWQSLMSRKGPYDSCHGVQLVLAALLGQTYALLSNNPSIRTTAFVFHGLGFYWARTSGMYNWFSFPLEDIPTNDAPKEEKMCRWKTWAAKETQRRAILGHYILDGLIAQSSGSAPSTRHVINSIGTACREATFSAQTVEEWIVEMQSSVAVEQPISSIYASLLSPEYISSPIPLSEFSISVVLEGLQSLVSDLHEATPPAIGITSQREIIYALINLYEGNIVTVGLRPAPECLPLLLRWHTISLELNAPSTALFQSICSTHKSLKLSSQGPMNNHIQQKPIDLHRWSKSAAGMRALLHAIAIKQLLCDIPPSRALAPHIPNAIFASAIIFSAMCLCGIFTIRLPTHFRWQDAWGTVLNQSPPVYSPLGLSVGGHEEKETSADDVLENLDAGGTMPMKTVPLLNDINFLQLSLKTTIASRWTLSAEMDDIIGQLSRLAHEHSARAR